MKYALTIFCFLLLLFFSCGRRADGPNISETTNGYVALVVSDSSGGFQDKATVIAVPVSYNVLEESDTLQLFDTLQSGLCTLSLPQGTYYNIFVLDTLNDYGLFLDSVKSSSEITTVVDTMHKNASMKVENDEVPSGAKAAIEGSPFSGVALESGLITVPFVPAGVYSSVVYYKDEHSQSSVIGLQTTFFPNEVTKIKELSTEVKFQNALGDTRFNFATECLVASDGTIWIGTTNGGVFAFDGLKWKQYESLTFNSAIQTISEGASGEILVGNDKALFQFNGTSFELVSIGGVSGDTTFYDSEIGDSFAYFLGDDFLVDTLNGQYRVSALPFTGARSLEVFSKDTLWIGTSSGGLYKITPTDTTQFTFSNSEGKLPSDEVSFVDTDGAGGIWIGTSNGLVHYEASGEWTTYNAANVISMNSNSITTGHYVNGTIWISTGDLTLKGFDGKSWRSYSNLSLFGHASAPILSITSEQDGTLWLASNGFGVVRFIAD